MFGRFADVWWATVLPVLVLTGTFLVLSPTVVSAQGFTAEQLLDRNRLLEIRLEMADSDWEQLRRQSRNAGDYFSGARLESPFNYFEADLWIDDVKIERVGVRKKGLFGSQDVERPSLKVKFDEFQPQDPVDGLSRLTLNNNKQDTALVSQLLTYDLFSQAGVHAPRCSLARVTVNGEYLGIYSNVESIKKPFLTHSFGDKTGRLYEGTLTDFHPHAVTRIDAKNDESDARRDVLVALAELLERNSSDLHVELDEMVDVDNYMRYWAMEGIIRFWDGYASNQNNYYVYENPTNGKLYFIPWGADASFSNGGPFSFGNQGTTAIYAQGIIANRLFHAEGGADRYRQTVIELMDEVWNEDQLVAEIDRVQELVADHLHPRQQNALRSMDTTRDFIRSRRQELERELQQWPPSIAPEPRMPLHTIDVGSVQGAFHAIWQEGGEEGPVEGGESTLAFTFADEEVQSQSNNAVALINVARSRGFGRQSREPPGPPQRRLVLTSENQETGDLMSVSIVVDESLLVEASDEPIEITGSYSEVAPRTEANGPNRGFGNGGGFGPGGGFGGGGIRRTVTGTLWLDQPSIDGGPISGRVELAIAEVHGGMFGGQRNTNSGRNTRPNGNQVGGPRQRPPSDGGGGIQGALDANGDGVLSTSEIENASEALKKLDANGDGRITPDELGG